MRCEIRDFVALCVVEDDTGERDCTQSTQPTDTGSGESDDDAGDADESDSESEAEADKTQGPLFRSCKPGKQYCQYWEYVFIGLASFA